MRTWGFILPKKSMIIAQSLKEMEEEWEWVAGFMKRTIPKTEKESNIEDIYL